MPDEELFRLAGANKLRENLHAQVMRMLADARSEEFVRHFVGQWLQARDIESVQINAFAVISRDDTPDPAAEERRTRFRELSRKPSENLTDLEKKELERHSRLVWRLVPPFPRIRAERRVAAVDAPGNGNAVRIYRPERPERARADR